MNRVFVYGTLKSGNRIRGLDAFPGANFIGKDFTADEAFDMMDLGPFPAVIPGGRSYIEGEVWEVSAEVFDQLDEIEGYPDFYLRQIIETQNHGAAWIYYLLDDRGATRMQPDEKNILRWTHASHTINAA